MEVLVDQVQDNLFLVAAEVQVVPEKPEALKEVLHQVEVV
jgi:hypothetical protein